MDDKQRKEAIGKRIKAARKKFNMSQKALQEKTNIKDSEISLFECGKREPNTANLAKLAHALNTTMDELYFGDESNSFIENAPDFGAKIVNCFSELFLEGEISKIEYDEYSNKPFLKVWGDTWAIRRLLDSLHEFAKNKDTYPDPDLFLGQLKQSVVNEINNNHRRS